MGKTRILQEMKNVAERKKVRLALKQGFSSETTDFGFSFDQ